MSNQQDLTKFEFLLTLEKNIVCQRFFNVPNYNPKARRSLDLYYEVKNICEDISEDLKIKNLDYLAENQNFFLSSDYVDEISDKDKENFLLQIKFGDEVFIERIFSAHYFHPKVRYTVDIRPRLKKVLGNLTNILSSRDLETKYLNYQL